LQLEALNQRRDADARWSAGLLYDMQLSGCNPPTVRTLGKDRCESVPGGDDHIYVSAAARAPAPFGAGAANDRDCVVFNGNARCPHPFQALPPRLSVSSIRRVAQGLGQSLQSGLQNFSKSF
jgi:hypothetical protein